MSTAILSSKGQITIPAAVRSGLGIETGDRIEFVEVAPGSYELVAATLPVTALKGLVPKPAQPVSVEDMNAAVRRRATQAMEP
ncbi:AbrB/MazE/SpoVT family DNA-binding domain-containing protein [Salinisphaera sp.]|uniref:AbrB/MazE/SpoVT family DNA-binding domain-containing protein n=1 Tax=Salinisphaera sp. TaxID=1914330 RepID=UPI002D770930|nr:AbrB/MazE/SpoVT family DNA-binding domain-containing protein [Salinisphaera sp.]HET7314039.1 AbrB/MazE/SpoVT family DNA-binding domain-containing protein [Salinisphaera sp.]